MTINLILAIGIMIIAGFFGGMVVNRFKFPRITGYIIVGMLLSPSVLHIVSEETIGSLDIITTIVLGVIAYSIGGSLRWESIRKLGKSIAWIIPFESLGAWLLVTLTIALLSPLILTIPNASFSQTYFPMALVIGAMACATAPAATMAVIQEYRAKGPLTTILLAVVALDDAVAVIAFAIALHISQPLATGVGGISVYHMVAVPFLEIVGSIAIGVVFGFVLVYIAKLVTTRPLLLVLVLGIIMLCIGVTDLLGISSILANMVLGFIVINRAKRNKMFLVIDDIEDVMFAVFFVLAGMHFNFMVIETAGILAILIVLGRFSGKYLGASIGAVISHAPGTVRKYLGLALLPKAGVTIGLALLAKSAFPTFGAIMFNGILASVIINELIAPPLTKYAIFKAGEQMKYDKTTQQA